MALTVYTNNYAIAAQKNLTTANNSLSKSIERLSSGLRINHAADDASGLAISEKLRGQIRGMAKASVNAQDAISFLQTAEGGMELIGDMLQRLRELAVQAGNGTYTANDRRELQKEVDQLKDEIDRISASTEFNTKKLLTGTSSGLWSSDSNAIEGIFRGKPAQGNYRLELNVDPGQNAIYKTDVMTVNKDFIQIQPSYKNRTVMKDFLGSRDIAALDGAEMEFGAFRVDDSGKIISGIITHASIAPISYYQNANSLYKFGEVLTVAEIEVRLSAAMTLVSNLTLDLESGAYGVALAAAQQDYDLALGIFNSAIATMNAWQNVKTSLTGFEAGALSVVGAISVLATDAQTRINDYIDTFATTPLVNLTMKAAAQAAYNLITLGGGTDTTAKDFVAAIMADPNYTQLVSDTAAALNTANPASAISIKNAADTTLIAATGALAAAKDPWFSKIALYNAMNDMGTPGAISMPAWPGEAATQTAANAYIDTIPDLSLADAAILKAATTYMVSNLHGVTDWDTYWSDLSNLSTTDAPPFTYDMPDMRTDIYTEMMLATPTSGSLREAYVNAQNAYSIADADAAVAAGNLAPWNEASLLLAGFPPVAEAAIAYTPAAAEAAFNAYIDTLGFTASITASLKTITADVAGIPPTSFQDFIQSVVNDPRYATILADATLQLNPLNVDPSSAFNHHAQAQIDLDAATAALALAQDNYDNAAIKLADAQEQVEMLQGKKLRAELSDKGTATIQKDFIKTANATIEKSGFVQVEFLSGVENTTIGTDIPNVRFSFVDAVSGEKIDRTLTLLKNTPVDGGVSREIDFGNGVKFLFQMSAGTTMASSIYTGDKMLFSVQAAIKNDPDNGFMIDAAKDAYVTLKMYSNDDNDPTTPEELINGPKVFLPNGKNTGASMSGVTITKSGSFAESTVSWQRNYAAQELFSAANTVKFDAFLKGDVASLSVKLKDIGLFTNPDGRMILDNTLLMSIYGNGVNTDISFEGDDTIEDLLYKLQAAIYTGLDMGATSIDMIDLVHYVTATSAQSYGLETVPGTFVMQTAKTGRQSQLSFIGDESLMNAMSIVKIQNEKNSAVSVDVYNAHTNEFVGSDTVTDYTLRGVIKNVDVKIQSDFGLDISYDADARRMVFTPIPEKTAFLHVVDHSTEIQVGANEGQKFDISVEQINTISLEISDAYVMTMETSQKAITMFDQALEKVNHARATIGAQINRLEYSMQNLDTGRQNLTASESRIRDLDVAAESAEFAKNQILVNAAVAMLAQANQLPQTALQLIGGR